MRYKFVHPRTERIVETLTDAQFVSLRQLAHRFDLLQTIEVHPVFGDKHAVMIDVGHMWIGVEADGYAHS